MNSFGSGDAETDSLLASGYMSDDHEKRKEDGDLQSSAGVVAERGVGGSALFG